MEFFEFDKVRYACMCPKISPVLVTVEAYIRTLRCLFPCCVVVGIVVSFFSPCPLLHLSLSRY